MRLLLLTAACAGAHTNATRPFACSAGGYASQPLSDHLGVVVAEPVGLGCLQQLKADVDRHGVVLLKDFRGGHLELSRALGSTWERPDTQGPAPHGDIQRLANSEKHGTARTQCGMLQNWHTHGLHIHTPFRYQVIHGVKAVRGMGTTFMSMAQLVRRQPKWVQTAWREPWMRMFNGVTRPLVFDHPHTGAPTMTIHSSHEWITQTVYNPGTPRERAEPSWRLLKEVSDAIAECKDLELHIDWEDGDLMVIDNLALMHSAGTETDATDQLRIIDFTDIYDAATPPPALMRADRPPLLYESGPGAKAWHLDTGRRCLGMDEVDRRIAKDYIVNFMEEPVPKRTASAAVQ